MVPDLVVANFGALSWVQFLQTITRYDDRTERDQSYVVWYVTVAGLPDLGGKRGVFTDAYRPA
jgi:hypothetical protein